ncbi:hypothetical protein FVE85_4524 [Porphyridium purpureum]|uniref:Uncharacterized protein n=1 Tax=Porphyridium purpureum TaxID=35688 RepID=A0A5J4YKW3_PORPP|nr:hypothetical protein FVE85_4524 [Porphyridium purpureum]|eukprot:POR6531..scf297_16
MRYLSLRSTHRLWRTCVSLSLRSLLGRRPRAFGTDSSRAIPQTSAGAGLGEAQHKSRLRSQHAGGVSYGESVNVRERACADTQPTADEVRLAAELKQRLSARCPLVIMRLKPGSRHRGMILCGRVSGADSCLRQGSTHFLLEDLASDLVQVCISTTKRLYKVGEAVAIAEPLYKVGPDGTPTVFVDEPDDVVEWRYPESSSHWKELGNTYAEQDEGALGIMCLEKALLAPDVIHVLPVMSVLYNNMAMCDFQLQKPTSAVWLAGTAVVLNRSNTKAWHRLIVSLERAGRKDAARRVLTCAPKLPGLYESEMASPGDTDQKSASMGLSAWSKCVVDWSHVSNMAKQAASVGDVKWEEHRKRAKALFACGSFNAARRLFLMELVECYAGSSRLLANIFLHLGQVHESVKNDADALMFATVSCVLDPKIVAPWIQRCRLVEKLGYPVESRDWLERLLIQVKSGALPTDMLSVKALFVDACEAELERLNSLREKKDRDLEETITQADDHLTHALAIAVHQREAYKKAAWLVRCLQLVSIFPEGRACPAIHEEISADAALWPVGIDGAYANKILSWAYLAASIRPWLDAICLGTGRWDLDLNYLQQRWHGLKAVELVRERSKAGPLKFGEVIDWATETGGRELHDVRIRMNFANEASNPLCSFKQGTTHVSVGFNDLSELLSCPLEPPDLVHEGGNGCDHKPFRFVGFEVSEFSVAKSLVVEAMLCDTAVPLVHVLQVWYSTAWTVSALASFRAACGRMLAVRSCSLDEKVVSFLRWWLSEEPVSIQASRQKWFAMVDKEMRHAFMYACSFRRKKDRSSLVRYFADGEVGVRQSEDTDLVGSLTYWNERDRGGRLDMTDLFATIPMRTLVENMGEGRDIYDIAVHVKMSELARLRDLLCRGAITVELHRGMVTPDDAELVGRIAALRPFSMSWSNVVDYVSMAQFHEMAPTFGAKRHFGYFMNWIAKVYGTCAADYCQDESGRALLHKVMETELAVRRHPLVKQPPLDDGLNVLGHALSARMQPFWIKYFESWGHPSASVVAQRMLEPHLLSRSYGVLFVEWTYHHAQQLSIPGGSA